MNNLYVQYLDFTKGVTSSVECIDFDIDASELNEWLENFADDFWGYNSIGSINLPDDRDEIIIVNDDNSIVASIKYTDFLDIFSGAKISRKYALLRKSTKDVHYSDEEKYFSLIPMRKPLWSLRQILTFTQRKFYFLISLTAMVMR